MGRSFLELEGHTEVQVVEAVAEFSEATNLLREEVATSEEESPVDVAGSNRCIYIA